MSGNQDCKQRATVSIEFLIELYRVVIGTCLIYFVPNNTTSISFIGIGIPTIAFYLNAATLAAFLVLYGIELYRENTLITYLEVTPLLGTDNESVGEVVANLDPKFRKKIYWIDTIYVTYAGGCMCIFTANTIFSGIVLIHNLDNKTITTFITDILFMMTKLYRIYYVINTEKNIFYSAYMTNFVQYNDLDPREREKEKEWQEDWISVKIEQRETEQRETEEHITLTIDD